MHSRQIRAIIVDDERLCIETLQWEIEQHCKEVKVVATCQSGEEAIIAIQQYQPQLLFLDIEMPYMNGFEMLSKLSKIDFHIIFTTAYDKFAIRAIKFHALDYLLKPIGGKEIKNALKSIDDLSLTVPYENQIKSLLHQMLKEEKRNDRIGLPTLEGVEMVDIDEILYIKSDSNYSEFHLVDSSTIIISKTLKRVELVFFHNKKDFLRIHQSYIVNINHIKRYNKGAGGTIVISNGDILPVSRAKKVELLERLFP